MYYCFRILLFLPVLNLLIFKWHNENFIFIRKLRNPICFHSVSHERLEVDPTAHKSVELDKILSSETAKMKRPLGTRPRTNVEERPNSEGFVDDPDVPPLI